MIKVIISTVISKSWIKGLPAGFSRVTCVKTGRSASFNTPLIGSYHTNEYNVRKLLGVDDWEAYSISTHHPLNEYKEFLYYANPFDDIEIALKHIGFRVLSKNKRVA